MDAFTRWVEASALKVKSANEVAKFLIDNVFTRHGAPKVIIRDQGKEFANKVVEEVCKIMGSRKTTTSPYKIHSVMGQ